MKTRESAAGRARINVGSASVVVIFAVVCLTVFSVLSLSTASAEKKLVEKSAQSVSDYYSADLLCAETASDLKKATLIAQHEEAIFLTAKAMGVDTTYKNGIFYFSYAKPIDENQELRVTLSIKDDKMTVLQWQVFSVGSWIPSDSVDVWDGN